MVIRLKLIKNESLERNCDNFHNVRVCGLV